MQLFYSKEIANSAKEFQFSKEESKHIVKVLRKKEGDVLHLTNGKGFLFKAIISVADQKRCLVTITSIEEKRKHDYYLHIVIAPTKMNDRLEWFLEKATEIGIDEITPIICDNSERKIIKQERLSKVVQSAMKQSLQMHLPKLNEAISFKQFISQEHNGQIFIAHCEEDGKSTIKEKALKNGNYTILIGPEGDFSSSEIRVAKEKSFIPIALGNNRLRTETAGIYACTAIALLNS